MWRSLASNALTLAIVVLFLAGGAIIWGTQEYRNPGPLEAAICLQVESGSNMREVSEDLAAQGAISSPALFRMGADYADKSPLLKAGSFLVPEQSSMAEIVDLVTVSGRSTCGTEVVYRVGVTRVLIEVRELNPETRAYEELARFNPAEEAAPEAYEVVKAHSDTQYRVALAEGVTSWQIVQSLNSLDVLDGPVEDIPAEGTLAPDSYAFVPGEQVGDLLAEMTEAQRRIMAEEWAEREEGLPYETPDEALIMASIVEKETSVPDERAMVASVFVNRLNRGMRLQTDPTVIYGVTNGRGTLGRRIRQSELRAENPWNTYVIDGLPITPIANPGRAAIEAALNPDESNYIFFVADGTGGHAFATNLDDHNRNVAAWRQIEAEREAAESAVGE